MQALELHEQKNEDPEFNASEVRKVLQELFPTRKLVLSQFTFFNQIGVSKPSGESFRRGRRCYKTQDLLPIAVVLALKEQGIPNKNIVNVPALVQEHCEKIFSVGVGARISGFRDVVCMNFPNEPIKDISLMAMLDCEQVDHSEQNLFWSFDVGQMANDLEMVVRKLYILGQTEGISTNNQDNKQELEQESAIQRLKAVA